MLNRVSGLLHRFSSCQKLARVDLTGIKGLTDAAVRHAYCLRQLRMLILKSCNNISDEVLKELAKSHTWNGELQVVNYYGVMLGKEDEPSCGIGLEY